MPKQIDFLRWHHITAVWTILKIKSIQLHDPAAAHTVIHWISTKLLLLGCWCQSLWCYCRVLPLECITEPLIRPVTLNWVHQHAAYVHISLSMLSFSVFFLSFLDRLNYKTWEHFLEKQACEDYSCWQAGRRIAQSLFKNKTYTLHTIKISQD